MTVSRELGQDVCGPLYKCLAWIQCAVRFSIALLRAKQDFAVRGAYWQKPAAFNQVLLQSLPPLIVPRPDLALSRLGVLD